MIRVAIVEDEAAVREQLAGYVQRCTRQYGTLFEVTMFTDGLEILEEYRPVYDIIFWMWRCRSWTVWRRPAVSALWTARCS
mgnify:CR=1 FL=1